VLTDRRAITRQRAVSWAGVAFAAAIAVKLVIVQYVARDVYAAKAESQQVKETAVVAERGRILDRNHRVLATSLEGQSFFVNNISDRDTLKAIAVRFSRRAGESEAQILERLRGGRSFVWLARQVVGGPDPEDLPQAVGRVVEMRRTYPLGEVAGQLIGYTNIDNVGIEGIERTYEEVLGGTPGEISSRIDGKGRQIGDYAELRRLPVDGQDMILTIDSDYQSIAEEELLAVVDSFSATSAMAVILDPSTGDVLTMANVPLYDPNAFATYPPKVRRNRTVTDVFEPGSTFKIVAVSAALDMGLHRPTDLVFCENGRLAVQGGVIRDTHPSGMLTVAEVIEESSNIGTIKIARKVGAAGLYRYMRLYGFGAQSGSGAPGEAAGSVRHPSKWSGRSLETMAIGQEVSLTALQLCAAYGVVANGGLLIRPRITVDPNDAAPDTVRRVISEAAAADMREFFEGVVKRGTGKRAAVPGFQVGGKTGTAQRPYEDRPGYDPTRYVSSFIGFLPVDRPELLCLVTVDSPRGTHLGSQVAAPVFSRIVQRVMSLRQTGTRHRAVVIAEAGAEAPPTRATGPADSTKQVEPVLAGLDAAQALRALARNGLDPGAVAAAPREVAVGPLSENPTPSDGAGMPDVMGVPMRQAVRQLTAAGIRVKATGSGVVVSQVPAPGEPLPASGTATVSCARNG
jgi:cell division protein FtsI/penicillin-binding protein 2